MRELGREALLAAQACRQAVQETVERRRELAELIVRFAGGEPPLRLVRSLQVSTSAVICATGRRAAASIQRATRATTTRTSAASAIEPSRAIRRVCS